MQLNKNEYKLLLLCAFFTETVASIFIYIFASIMRRPKNYAMTKIKIACDFKDMKYIEVN